MTRTVNFSSLSDNARLPNINAGQNWVNDRQRRFHSEPRRAAGKPTVQNNGSAFAFPTPQNGHLVSRDNPNGNHGNDSHSTYDPPRDGRRLQSLPPAKPKMDEFNPRQIRSAPNNEENNGQGAGQQRTNMAESKLRPPARSRISDNDKGRELPQRTHGKATRAYEERYLRSNKFASSWAQVRADNPAFNDLSPDGSPLASRKLNKDNPSPSHSNKFNSPRDSSPNTQDETKKEHKKSVMKQNRGRPYHKTRTKTRLKFTDENNNGGSPNSASNDEGSEADEDKRSPNSEQRERKVSKKKDWVDSVVIPPYEKPPPKHATMRYLDNLTFKPNINTGKDVLQTYIVKDKKPMRQKTADPNRSFSENEDGYDSPTNYSAYSQDESDDNSQERQKKEPFLNRREAIKYIKMNNVYGSDAYKKQRKEWFVQKFTEVQDTKAKYEAEQKREEKRKREENMKKQQRQLNYVREKFRKEQEHRFRTQYVTARVLEYEQVNRHVYGLPEDYLDLANEINRDSDDENAESPEQKTENQGNRSKSQEKNAEQPPKPVNKASQSKKGVGKKTNTSPTKGDNKKKKEEEAALAAIAKARENQKNWYTQPSSGPESPTIDNRSHASHATSDYESEKHPSDNIHNTKTHPTETDTTKPGNDAGSENRKNAHFSETPSHVKTKHSQTATQKRLQSQKDLYTREDPTRTKRQHQQQAPKQKVNGKNNSIQNKQNDSGASGNMKQSDKTLNSKQESDTNPGDRGFANKENDARSEKLKESERTETEPKSNLQSKPRDHQVSDHLNSNSQTEKQNVLNSKSSNNAISNKNNSNNMPSTIRGDDKDRKTEPNTRFEEVSKKELSDSNSIPNSKQEPVKVSSNHTPNTTQNTAIVNEQGAKSTPQGGHAMAKGKNNVNDEHGKDRNEPQEKYKEPNIDGKGANQRESNRLQSTQIPPKTSASHMPLNKDKQQTVSKGNASVMTPSQSSTHHVAPQTQQQHSSTPSVAPKQTPSAKTVPKIVTHDELEELSHQAAHPTESITKSGPRKDSVSSRQLSQHPQSPPKKINSRNTQGTGTNENKRRASQTEPRKPEENTRSQPKKKESVADRMFNINAGPTTWDRNKKTPKMEGIDTVVVTAKDKKGRDVKKRKDVKDVVKDADNLLKVNTDTRRMSSRQRRSRAVSPDPTLGSDFEVDDDDELAEDDIFERLRRKYNIAIDSDEEDDPRV